ncbi:uncharacterized protein LOC123555746 [Mercenaria mercenaria]|uniref:uncharacterized protein LOC123555746 n=1 Tax=Mercenaria mercenaria TaxID=6596 RepID=UPI00234F5550|nr:uncharacterized protein LOC123555746 [Mercenaria mercenaria]
MAKGLLTSFGCVLNKPTRLRGRARKLIHIPVKVIHNSAKEGVRRKLGYREINDSDPLMDMQREPDLQPDPLQEPQPEHNTDADPMQEPQPEPNTEADPIQESLPEPDKEADPTQESLPESNTEADPIQESLPESETHPEPLPEEYDTQNESLPQNPEPEPKRQPDPIPVPKSKLISHLDILTVKEKEMDICHKCRKQGRIGQCWVGCDGCGLWYPKTCAAISAAIYKRLQAWSLDWFCDVCKKE